VIGNHVNLAARLQGQAAGKQLVIDEATYRATPDKQSQFNSRQVELKGYSQALNAHLLELENIDCLEQRLMEHDENPTLY
jgi:class 3 adenylate cyclase